MTGGRSPRLVAAVALVGGPAVLAFFSGGYFAADRAWAGLLAWVLVFAGALRSPRPWTVDRPARVALLALAGFAAWTLLSILWAPIAGNAYHAAQVAFLYLGAVLAAALLLAAPGAPRALAEPGLALGALAVIGYGISERLLPGVLHFARSVSAQGRLEQPLTYWNAMGELAALGLVLCVRLAGTAQRPRAIRAAAAFACAPMGAGLYVSFSRGALFSALAGLLALMVMAPRRGQVRALAICLGSAVIAALAVASLHGFTSQTGSLGARETDGVLALVALALLGCAAAFLVLRGARARSEHDSLRLPRRAPALAVAVICGGLALAITLGAKEGTTRRLSAGAGRLATLQSNRYEYWRVALVAFSDEPLHGVGAGGWSVYWLRDRRIDDFAQDAHSLPLQTMSELGLVGLGLLVAFFAALAVTGRVALRRCPEAAAGPLAVLVAWTAHQPLDWDWQMPALTLVAMVLAGFVLGIAGDDGRPGAEVLSVSAGTQTASGA